MTAKGPKRLLLKDYKICVSTALATALVGTELMQQNSDVVIPICHFSLHLVVHHELPPFPDQLFLVGAMLQLPSEY